MSGIKKLTGLFFGAGASYEAGMPLLWELTAEIKDWLTPAKLRDLNAGWRLQSSGFADQVIDDLVLMLEQPAVHYEAMLGYVRKIRPASRISSMLSWRIRRRTAEPGCFSR
jgi:hypothetical protein